MPTAFALRADHENVFAGGTLHINNQTVDLAQRLADGNGVIVVQDNESLLEAALRDYPALKQVPMSQAETASQQAESGGGSDVPDNKQEHPASQDARTAADEPVVQENTTRRGARKE